MPLNGFANLARIILENFSRERAARAGFFALIISSVFAFGAFMMLSGQSTTTPDGRPIDTINAAYIVAFWILSWALIWPVYFLFGVNQSEDDYSWIRRSLRGDWATTYTVQGSGQSMPSSIPGSQPNPQVVCKISINPKDRKLEMKFIIMGNPLWENVDHVINTSALSQIDRASWSLVYYYEGTRRLMPEWLPYIAQEENKDESKASRIEIPIQVMGRVYFKIDTEDKIVEMKGNWYDLNGNVSRVHTLATEVGKLKAGDAYCKRLSEIVLPGPTYSAMVGAVNMRRLS